MKHHRQNPFRALALLALLAILAAPGMTIHAQGTAFTYQGRFYDTGARANGSYDLTFTVFSDSGGVNQISGTVTNYAVPINNGLFTVMLDFGPGVFSGPPLWLQIGAETNGAGGIFTLLTPLQQLTPTPYAIYATGAGTAASANFAYSANSVAAGSVTGPGIASGSVVKSLNSLQDAVTLSPGANITITPSGNTLTIASSGGGGGGGNSWSLTGNAGTSPTAGNFIGTTDNQPLELDVNGERGLRLEPVAANGAVNIIGGSSGNSVSPGTICATIAGGGATAYDGFESLPNTVAADFSTIGGGATNTIQSMANSSTIAGGYDNTIQNNATLSTISGGFGNTILSYAPESTIAGGFLNIIDSVNATIAGGSFNTILIGAAGSTIGGGIYNTNGGNAIYSAIGGGYQNSASGSYAAVPGGSNNVAGGNCSFAAGKSASANDNDSFVWSDGTRGAVSQGENSFAVLATGGAYFYTTTGNANVEIDNNANIVNNSGDLNFGATVRQMLNLYSTTYGIGVQNDDEYFRTAGQFYWYEGGLHNNNQGNSGGGTTLMSLTASGLTVNGTFVSASDRNLKEHFQPVDAGKVLDQVAALPITKWDYKADAGTEHIGPMAQDFYAAFSVGPDDKHITTIDEGGVALAAIQGLNQKLKEKDQEIQALEARLTRLEQMMNPAAAGGN